MTIFTHEWSRGFKSLLIWTLSMGAFIVILVTMFPQLEDSMAEASAMFANMGDFSKAFGLSELNMGTAIGYYGLETGNVLGIGGALFASIFSISMLAKEESEHSAEFLLTLPHTRTSIFFQKYFSMLSQIIVFHGLVFGIGLGAFAYISEEIPLSALAYFHVAQLLSSLQIATLCFGLSAFFRKNRFGVGIGLSLLLYFLNIMINVSEDVKVLRFFTPFYFADAAKVIPDESILWPECAATLGLALVFFVAGFLHYRRKDMHV